MDTTAGVDAMGDKGMPANLQRLWEPDGRGGAAPRQGLTRERIVRTAIGLADAEGLEAVSMGRVAERLGFTAMSLYRHVANKDELLAFMHDTAWEPPGELDTTTGEWRADTERWCRGMYAILLEHPWLERIRFGERVGTPSQLTWLDRGLRALAGTALAEYEKTAILLLLNGFVFWEARVVAETVGVARELGFAVEEAAAMFGGLLTSLADAERFPALRRAVDAGAFENPAQNASAGFGFGLDRILDGVGHLMAGRAPSEAPQG